MSNTIRKELNSLNTKELKSQLDDINDNLIEQGSTPIKITTKTTKNDLIELIYHQMVIDNRTSCVQFHDELITTTLDKIEINPLNPRDQSQYNTGSMEASIEQSGSIKEPVLVDASAVNNKIRTEKYYVLAGNRTTMALKSNAKKNKLKLSEVEVTWKKRVYTGPPNLVKRQLLIDLDNDNNNGMPFTVVDKMKVYIDLMSTGMTISDIAASKGQTVGNIEQVVCLARLSKNLLAYTRHKAQEDNLLSLTMDQLDKYEVEYTTKETPLEGSDDLVETVQCILGITTSKAKLLSRLIPASPRVKGDLKAIVEWENLKVDINEEIECNLCGILDAALDDNVKPKKFKEIIQEFKYVSELIQDVRPVPPKEDDPNGDLFDPPKSNPNSGSGSGETSEGDKDDPYSDYQPPTVEADPLGDGDDFDDLEWYDDTNVVHVVYKHDKSGLMKSLSRDEIFTAMKFEKYLATMCRNGDKDAIDVLTFMVKNNFFDVESESIQKFGETATNLRMKHRED